MSKINGLRWGAILIAGSLIWLILFLIFHYLNGAGQLTWASWLKSIVYVGGLIESIRFVNRRIDKHFPWQGNPRQRFFLQLTIDCAIALLLVTASEWSVSYFILEIPVYREWNVQSFILELLIVNLIMLLVTILTVSVDAGAYFFREWLDSLIEVERLKKESVEARFETLKNQINPHFLFNSLNTLASLVYVDRDKAATFIRQLSKVYRRILEHNEADVVRLDDELKTLEAYLYLLHTRFEDAFQVDIQLSETEKHGYVAPLSLQILIENAVKHNTVSAQDPLVVSIFAEDHFLVVQNRLQLKSNPGYSSNTGLKHVLKRYSYLSDLKPSVEKTTDQFIVKIPLLEKPSIPSKTGHRDFS